MSFRIVTYVAGALLAFPGVASAGTASVEPDPERPRSSGDVLRYRAADGEQNAVSLRAEDTSEEAWIITDSGAAVSALAPCVALDEHTARCPARRDRYIDRAEVDLGNLDDRLTSVDPTAEGATGTLRAAGGAGNDELVGGSVVNVLGGGDGNDSLVAGGHGSEANLLDGGPDDDSLRGGPIDDELDGGGGSDLVAGRGGDDLMTDGDTTGAAGPDVFMGGGNGCCLIHGGDRVVYARRSAPVLVDLADAAPDGESGEGDTLTGIESVEGGRGDDQLLGDDRRNALIGGRGDDTLKGRGRNDMLVPGRGAGRSSCGSGHDVVEPGDPGHRLDADCESVDLGDIGIYRLPAHPRQARGNALSFRVECPPNEDEDVGHARERCSGRVELVDERGRPVAEGRLPPGRWGRRALRLDLTRLGRVLAARGDTVSVVVHFVLRSGVRRRDARTGVERWTVPLFS